MLGGDEDRAAPLAAEADALDHADADQQDRGGDADALVAGQQADRGGRDAHQEQGDDQGGLAAELVAEVAEDDAAERAGEEADPEGGEGDEGAEGAFEFGEEHLVEDEGGGGSVDVEVEPLDGGADEGSDSRSAGGFAPRLVGGGAHDGSHGQR